MAVTEGSNASFKAAAQPSTVRYARLKYSPLFCDLPERLTGETLCFRQKVQSLGQLRIAFKQDAPGNAGAELVVVDLVLDRAFGVVAIVLEVLVGELHSARPRILLEVIQRGI